MKAISIIALLIWSLTSYSQSNIFDDYDFNSGKYVLIGFNLNASDNPEKRDSIGHFYIESIETLNAIEDLLEDLPKCTSDLGYPNYYCILVKNNEVKDVFYLYVKDNAIFTKNGYYKLDITSFFSFREEFLPLEYEADTLESLIEARNKYNSLVEDENVIIMIADWLKFDGYFEVNIDYDRKKIRNQEEAEEYIEGYLEENFSKNDYELQFIWQYNSTFNFRIICDPETYTDFNLPKTEYNQYPPVLNIATKTTK